MGNNGDFSEKDSERLLRMFNRCSSIHRIELSMESGKEILIPFLKLAGEFAEEVVVKDMERLNTNIL